uniref:Flp1 family type IVb pilin n=1 Tax=Eubacterium cellulosolvens TaxID=29322 RepID=UPI0006887BEF|nr:Flp1 family type IVb pilin [[Eubacterium] cellulosolvens]
MREKVMMAYLKGKSAVENAFHRFTSEEKGASDMVAVIVLIVIVIAAAVIFREQLIGAVEAVFSKLSDFVS